MWLTLAIALAAAVTALVVWLRRTLVTTRREAARRTQLHFLAITLRDGRKLAYRVYGEEKQPVHTVIYIHGAPGSRHERGYPVEELLVRRGLRLISIDRPGYGQSCHIPQRSVLHVAHDVEELCDALHLDRVSLVGFSSGATTVHACVHVFPERVVSATIIAGEAPYAHFPESLKKSLRATSFMLWLSERLTTLGVSPLLQLSGAIDRARVIRSPARAVRRVYGYRLTEEAKTVKDVHDFMHHNLHSAFVENEHAMLTYRRDIELSKRGYPFALSSLDARYFVWHGTKDAMRHHSVSEWVAAELHKGCAVPPRVTLVEGAGHGLHFARQHWEEILDEICSVL